MQHPPHRSWRPFALGLGSFLLIVLAFLAVGHFANAAITIENVGGTLGLGSADLKQTIVNILKWALGLLGLVAIIVMLYGGFLWLTSRGDEKKIDKAKRVLINGAIGLVIILVSWAIVLFIQRFITNATNSASAAQCGPAVGIPFGTYACLDCVPSPPGDPNNGKFISNGSCIPPTETETWSALNEVPAVGATNVSLCSQAAELFGGLRIPSDNNASAGTYTVNEVSSGTNLPGTTFLGMDHTGLFMHTQDFKPNTEYEVTRAGFQSSSTPPLPLTLPPQWRFTTGTVGDDTPPTVSVVAPTGTINCLKPELDAVFSEPMLPLSVNVDNITISPTPSTGAKLTSIVMNGSLDGFTATFDKPLDPSVTYTVTLNADTSTAIVDSSTGGKYIKGFKDMCVKNALDGNANGTAQGTPTDDYAWTFTTANTTTIDCTPKISSIEPTAYYGNTIGNPQQALTIMGENFGVTGSGVLFPGTSAFATTASGVGSSCFNSATMPSGYRPKQLGSVACIRSADWTSTQITTLVPAGLTPSVSSLGPVTGGAIDGPVIVQKTQNSPPSNAVDIQTPHIDWVSPDNGKEGTFITINGTHFGNTAGNVYFRRTDGTQVSGSVPACAGANGWTEDATSPDKRSQIIVQVPAGFTAGDLADIQVAHSTLPGAAGRSNLYRFTMNNQTHPGLCSIVPQCHNTGGGTLTATGEGFGSDITQLTSLYIPSDTTKPVTNGTLGNFNSSAGTIESTAQAALGNDMYRFQMRVGTDATNPLDYKIPCLPAPAVVQDGSCNPSTGAMPSPNPVPNATNICPNISVEARFNQPMSLADLSNVANVQVSRCNNADTFDCSSPTNVLVSSIQPGSTWVRYGFGSNFEQNRWYQVTLKGANIHSVNPPPTGVALGADFSWHFRVRNDSANCSYDAVVVSPASIGPLSTGQQGTFQADATNAQCALLTNIPGNFSWSVTVNPLLVGLGVPTTVPVGASPSQNNVVATVQGGSTNGTSTITAALGGKTGSGNLIVQRDYCETNNDCASRTNSQGATCANAKCNIAQRTCEPLILDLQSGTQTGKTVNGPMGNLINVRGCYFGAGKGANGKVTFTNGSTVNGSFAICGPAGWTNDSIRVQTMPDTDPPASPNSIWGVQVVADSTLQSNNDATYTISSQCSKPDGGTTGIPGSGMPILCNISQPTGREGDLITYYGDRFVPPTPSSQTFFTQATDSATQITKEGAATNVIPATPPPSKIVTSHVPGGTAIPQPPATSARTTVGVQNGADYCIVTPVDFAVSCTQNSECSTGCCTGSPNGTCKATSTCYGLIASASPAAGTLACRNSTFRVDFTELMQTSTLNSSTAYLYDTANPGVAIPARLDVLYVPPVPPAPVGTNSIVLTPNSPLPNATYRIFVQGGKGGVTSATGRLLDANFTWPVPSGVYTVNDSSTLCKIARVEIQPASDIFTCSGDSCADDVQPTPPGPAGNQHQYTVAAYDASNRSLGLQAWTWTQGDSGGTGGPTNVYTQGAAGSVCPGNATSSVYCSQSLNVPSGNELLMVDVVGSGGSGTGTASMNVRSFLCAKPWPAAGSFPFRDPDRTAAPANPSHNFTFGFCTDDLQGASLSDPVQSPFLTGEVNLSKEYFMFVADKNGIRTGDTIGIRIFGSAPRGYGTDLSPKRWYKQRFGKESTGTTLEVDGYPALREGRTVYVVADNYLSGGNSYPNVYVISYNDKAKSETVSIFDQVLKSIKFNDFTTALPSTLLANLRADVKRIHAMQELVFGLADYYTVHKENPSLDTGSYIKNMSFSAWPSWQQSLGSTLGITMPHDPEVLWKPSATLCGPGFDQTSCWNEVAKTMQFPSRGISPADSHGLAYKYDPTSKRVQLYGTGSSNFYRHITTAIDVIDPAISICPSSPTGNSCLGFNFGINSTNFGQMSSWRLPSALDKTAPTVNIELPLAGTIAGAVTFVMTASDETGGSGMQRVDAKIMRSNIPVASTTLGAPDKDGKYRWTWNSRSVLNSPPMYTLMVTATDRAGNTTSPTQNRDYTVTNPPGDSEPPIITASTQPGQWDGSTDVTLTASATDQHTLPVNNTGVVKIEFYLGSSKLGEGLNPTCTPTCSTTFSTSVTVPVATIKGFPNGSYTYSVVAYDGFGNTSVKNATVIIGKSTGDTAPPSVVIIQPTGTVSGANTDVLANASDASGIDRVEFFIDGGFRVADFSGPYSFSWLLTGYADNSSHTIRAVAYDRYGNQATATQTVTYTIVTGPDTERPVISNVTATLAPPPADTGATVAMDGAQLKNTVTLNATLTDNVAMLKTELRIDGVKIPLIGSAYTCSSPQVCTLAYLWDTLPEIVGQHTVSITAYDTSNYATTVTQTVNVTNQVIMSFSSPQNGSTVKDVPGTGTCAITKSRTCTTTKDCPMTAIGTCDQNPGSKCLGDAACPAPGDFCVGPHEACNISPAGVPVVIDVTRTCRADQLLSSVQFFLDTSSTPLPGSATCTNGRCTYTWNSKATSSNGSHTLTAKGQDSLGCQGGAKSMVVVNNSVTDTTPPVIDNFQFGTQTWGSSQPKYINSTNRSGNITVLAHDPPGGSGLAQITIAINGTTVQTCATSPCQYFWSPADGANYTVIVGASDVAGNAAPDQSQVVNVDTTPPNTSTWQAPADGSTINSPPDITMQVAGSDPQVNGYASGVFGVIFYYVDTSGVMFPPDYVGSGGVYSWVGEPPPGTAEYFAEVIDRAGNTFTTPPVTITVVGLDTRAPWITIDTPYDGYVSGTFTPIARGGDWGGTGIRDVQFYLDGALLGSPVLPPSPFSASASVNTTTMTQGSAHTIYAVACDKATPTNNCTTSSTVTFLVNNNGGTNCGPLICSGATPNCCGGPPYVCQSPNSACSYGGNTGG